VLVVAIEPSYPSETFWGVTVSPEVAIDDLMKLEKDMKEAIR